MKTSEIIDKLKSNDPTYEDLDLSGIRTDRYSYLYYYNDWDLLALANAIRVNHTIKRFSIASRIDSYHKSDIRWTPIGIEAIGNALKDHPALNTLDLNLNVWEETSFDLCGFLLSLMGTSKIQDLYLRIDNHSCYFTKSKFNLCHMMNGSMRSFTDILKNNKLLTKLDLSDNSFELEEIKIIADILPFLPRLKTLFLRNVALNAEALDYLAMIWRTHNLKISTLDISDRVISVYDNYIKAIHKIIENNKYLKKLYMQDQIFREEHLYQLKNLLSDPSKCQLQELRFGGDQQWNVEFYNDLINILKANKHFRVLSAGHVPSELYNAWKCNEQVYKKSQQFFVENAIRFGIIYFSTPKNRNPHFLPLEIFLLIISHLGKETLGMSDKEIIECGRLIFENFSIRRKLIESKEYIPITKLNQHSSSDIHKWWSHSLRDNNSKPIFRQRTEDSKEAEYAFKCNIM